MADETKDQKPPSLISYYAERFRRGVLNRIVNKIFPQLGAKRQPQVTREGRLETADIKRELENLFKKNQTRIIKLRRIEVQWNELDNMIWKEEDPDSLINLYKKVSYLVDPIQADEEARTFREGTGITNTQIDIDIGTPASPNIVPIGWKNIGSKRFIYIEPDNEVITEDLSIIGYNNMRQFGGMWEGIFSDWINRVQHDPNLISHLEGIKSQMHDFIAINISKHLTAIDEREREFHSKRLSPNVNITQEIVAKRVKLDEIRPENVRFRHTYKIIAPIIKDSTGNLRYFSNEFPAFRRDDEVEAGKDDNGYPLEVYEEPANSGNWYVLLDKWWAEIASNEWQSLLITTQKTITNPKGEFEYPVGSGIKYKGKGSDGGAEIWTAKVTNGVERALPYSVNYTVGGSTFHARKVPDSAFVKDLDILDMSVYMYNEYDSYRDDFRDGRYHKWSKTTTDYILAVEGISTSDYTTFGKLPYYRSLGGFIPKQDITFDVYPMRDYVGATPNHFLNVPEDEARVSREYHMKCNTPLPTNMQTPGLPDNILVDVRRPSHLNPAFDRRALNAKSDVGSDRFFIHWGRMYYYEDTSGINKWSENPYPHISTRGIAKWIIYRILMDLPWENAVLTAKNDDGYDYGIRRPLVGGEFIKDPLGATDLISKENPIG